MNPKNKKLCRACYIFVGIVLFAAGAAWCMTHIVYIEKETSTQIDRATLKEINYLFGSIDSASVVYAQEHDGLLPRAPSDLIPYFKQGIQGLLPLKARYRLHIDDMLLTEAPSFVDALGLWSFAQMADGSRIIVLSPQMFGWEKVAFCIIKDGTRNVKIADQNEVFALLVATGKRQ